MFKSKYYLHPDALEMAKKLEDGICVFEYNNDFDIYDDAIILPLIKYPETRLQGELSQVGGVCDGNLGFLAGYEKGDPLLDYAASYEPKEIDRSDETVIFSGDLNNHFGHFIQDSMSRLWYAAQNKDKNYKVAILKNAHWHWPESSLKTSYHLKFLNLIGISNDRILIIDRPTQFKRVIVPKQSIYWSEGYNKDLASIVYDAARNRVAPKTDKRIYLSRTKFEEQEIFNEKYFEKYFSNQGFKVIYPEQLPLEEQVAYMAGADEIACTYGTLSHWTMFARNKTRLISLLRYPYAIDQRQLIIDKFKELDSVYIDTTLNFFPTQNVGSSYLIGPGIYWDKFLKQEYATDINTDIVEYLNQADIKFGSYIQSFLQKLHVLRVFGYRFDYITYLKSLYLSFYPSGYSRVRGDIIKTHNPLFKEKIFRLKTENSNTVPVIQFLADGKVYPLDGRDLEEKYWSSLNGRLYLMDSNFTILAEFTVPSYVADGKIPKYYKGALHSDISVSCTITEIRPNHNIRNYVIRQFIIKHLVGKKAYKKLKQSPERFFGDSKSRFIKFLGNFYVRKHNTIVFDQREAFKAYFSDNDISEKTSLLKKGLDSISRIYVDSFMRLSEFWYRIDYTGSMYTDYDHLKRRQTIEFGKSFKQPFPDVLLVEPYFFAHNYCLDDLPDEVLRNINGKTIIDGGGYNGDTALAFHRHFPNSEIHVFEPLKFYTQTIQEFLEEDNCDNKITIINKGLGESKTRSEISYEISKEEADITTIDEIYANHSTQIGLIKLDTDGPEIPIIIGGQETIKEQKPVIAAAIYYSPVDFFELKGWLADLNPDYRFMIRRTCFRRPQTGLMLIAY